MAIQGLRECYGVGEGNTGTLAKVWRHGMSRIPEKSNVANRPLVTKDVGEACPASSIGDSRDHIIQIWKGVGPGAAIICLGGATRVTGWTTQIDIYRLGTARNYPDPSAALPVL
jgi:hypothetical protein